MDPMPVILDISSDEDVGWRESFFGCFDDDNVDWISELLEEVNREEEDTDEVEVVAEIAPKHSVKSWTVVKSPAKDLDDDCIILDGDPDKPVAVGNDLEDGPDDLVIVGEKGQIACRDYPHPRHLCAKFPFSSSRHEMHCDQCHCYVCDSLAPCALWGTGSTHLDHCNATDKEELWKLQRRNLKECKKAPQPFSNYLNTSPAVALPPLNQVPQHPPLQFNSVAQSLVSQVSGQTTIRACSSTNVGIPNIISHGRNRRIENARNRFLPHSISQQLHNTRNSFAPRGRGHGAGNLGSQILPSRTIFKKVGCAGSALTNQSACHSSNYKSHNRAVVSHYSTSHPPIAAPSGQFPANWQNSLCTTNSEIGMQQGTAQLMMSDIFASSVPCHQPQPYNQPIPQANNSENFYQHRDQSQNAVDPDCSDFRVNWPNDTSVSNQNFSAEAEFSSAAPVYEPSSGAEYTSQFPEFVKPGSLELEFENWIQENQSVARAPEGNIPSEQNILSPNPASMDALLFDFETCLNGRTQV